MKRENKRTKELYDIIGLSRFGQTLSECGMPIIAIKNEQESQIQVQPDYVFSENDVLILLGRSTDIRRFEEMSR